MKKTKVLVLTIILALSFTLISNASSDVNVTVDGELVEFEAQPFIDNDRTLVPVRFISESLGANVDWNQELKEVTITKGDKTIKLIIDNNKVAVNDEVVELDTKAVLKDSTTFVPVSFISKTLDSNVKWNEGTRTVEITSNKAKKKEIEQAEEQAENDEFIEPKFEVKYNDDGTDSYWFDLQVSNYEEYKKSEDEYKVNFECLNYPELNYYYTIITTDWIKIDRTEWRDNPYRWSWGLLQYHLLEPNTETGKMFETKADMKIQLKVTVWNTTKDLKKEYNKEIEVKEVDFKW